MRSIFSRIADVSPLTRTVKKLAAQPEPNAYKLTRLPFSSAGATVESREARQPYNEAVYMLPNRREHAMPGSVFFANEAYDAATNVFSTFLSRSEAS